MVVGVGANRNFSSNAKWLLAMQFSFGHIMPSQTSQTLCQSFALSRQVPTFFGIVTMTPVPVSLPGFFTVDKTAFWFKGVLLF